MKTIRINFTGFWPTFDKSTNLFVDILKEKYDVQLSDKPDFLIVSPLGEPFAYMNYDCVRILFTGEPLAPDFNVFDYAIGFDRIVMPDAYGDNRFFRYPLCFFDINKSRKCADGLTREKAKELLAEKKHFCNFIFGHRSAKGEREAILDALQRYKRVESAGSFLNNMPDGKAVPFTEEKIHFLRSCKFTIACESISYPGFITEKLIDPFYAGSVPVYYGDPNVELDFNPEAMVHIRSFSSLEDAVERIIKLDQDDEAYIQMLMEPKMISTDYFDALHNDLRQFLFRIFNQDKEDAYRRLRFYIQQHHEDCLKEYAAYCRSITHHTRKKVQQICRALSR